MNSFQSIRLISRLAQFILAFSLCTWVNFEANADTSQSFVMKDLAGKEYRLSDYHGKWVLVNYWATWCPSCLDEMPEFIALYDQHKSRDLIVLGIAVDYKNEQEVRHFVDDMLVSYPIILGNPRIYAQFGPPTVLPTTFIYNPQGKLVKIKRGQLSKQAIESILSESIMSPPPSELMHN